MPAQTWLRLTHRWLRPARTLGEAYAARDDNFLLLRLLAALMVMWSHSYVLSGSGGNDWIARLHLGPKVTAGSLAVDLFFLTSGLLVTGSYVERPAFWRFVRSRLLRIIPALVVCVGLCALVLGPLASELPVAAYFRSWRTFRYIGINLSFRPGLQWGLPGVFGRNPYPGVVNGSLWSLPGEVAMYVAVAVLGVTRVLSRRWLGTAVILGLVLLGWFAPVAVPFVPGPWLLRPCGFFAVGALCFLNRTAIPLRTDALLLLWLTAVFSLGRPWLGLIFPLVCVYTWFWFAYQPHLPAIPRGWDLSYGVYLWGFPTQQLMAQWQGGATTAGTNAIPAILLAFAAAAASWRFVEKPCLRFKRVRAEFPSGRSP
ncbi:MAG: acyltransferase [Deltaproteobacteria bacterium]|nr:acyltransferase [Deltaproteobacteria bacterium]